MVWQMFGNPQALAMLNKLRDETHAFQQGGGPTPPRPQGMTSAPAPEGAPSA
jgi:hypothetical protein